MKRFKNILAIYGDSVGAEDVLDRAEDLAKKNNARLTLIEILPERYSSLNEREEREKRLGRVASSLKLTHIDYNVVIGTPYIKVIKKVLKDSHDLVITSADSGSIFRDLYFGSLSKHLMRKCPCPVWVLKPEQKRKAKKILACIDPKSSKSNENTLDIKILDLATSLTRSKQAELHIINSWDVEGKDRESITSEIRDKDYNNILNRHEETHRTRVNNILNEDLLSELSYTLHFPRSSLPQKAIVNLIKSLEIELVVMGTVSRVGIAGLIIGNTAEDILSSVRCSIFTVKPDGFKTPVNLNSH